VIVYNYQERLFNSCSLNERILGDEAAVRVYVYTYWTARPGSTPQRGVAPQKKDLGFQILGVENANEKGGSRFGVLKTNRWFLMSSTGV
jgi:hypothetical protein